MTTNKTIVPCGWENAAGVWPHISLAGPAVFSFGAPQNGNATTQLLTRHTKTSDVTAEFLVRYTNTLAATAELWRGYKKTLVATAELWRRHTRIHGPLLVPNPYESKSNDNN